MLSSAIVQLCVVLKVINGLEYKAGYSVPAQPPVMNTFWKDTQYYYYGDSQSNILECNVEGIPKPNIEWYHNGKLLNDSRQSGNRRSSTSIDYGGRELSFPSASGISGYYQCRATNKYGTAVTRFIKLIEAKNMAWSNDKPKQKLAFVNEYIKLECRDKPTCIPPPTYRWYVGNIAKKEHAEVIRSDRFVVDQNGDLHILNAQENDTNTKGQVYLCSSYNEFLSNRNFGGGVELKVTKKSGIPNNRLASIVYYTGKTTGRRRPVYAYLGRDVTLLCIADGIPIPKIIWSYNDQMVKHVRGKTEISSSTRELRLRNIKESDEGKYTCTTTHMPRVSVTIEVLVVGKPLWRTLKPPALVTITEGTDVHMSCDARNTNGRGNVVTQWYKNFVYLSNGYHGNNEKILVNDNKLTIYNATKPDDLMSVQCNVSNEYGYRLTTTAVNVILKTTVTHNLVRSKLLEKGKNLEMNVRYVVDPLYKYKVQLRWYKDSDEITNEDSSTNLYKQGNSLFITSTNRTSDDDFESLLGNFTCEIDIIDVPSAKWVRSMIVLEKPPTLPAALKNEPFPIWIIILICVACLLIIIITVVIVTMYRNRGNVWSVEKKEKKAGRDIAKELEHCAFPTLSRASHIPEEYKYPPEDHEQVATNDVQYLISNDRKGGEEYPEQDLNLFDEDGSFIGVYDDYSQPRNSPAGTLEHVYVRSQSNSIETEIAPSFEDGRHVSNDSVDEIHVESEPEVQSGLPAEDPQSADQDGGSICDPSEEQRHDVAVEIQHNERPVDVGEDAEQHIDSTANGTSMTSNPFIV